MKITVTTMCMIAWCSLAGCTSFRTTSLYRFANDSLVKQQTNRPLKGLPVKLKVPSHVNVVIYEQQILLAPSKDEIAASEAAVGNANKAVVGKIGEIDRLQGTADEAEAETQNAADEVKYFTDQLALTGQAPEAREALTKLYEKAVARHELAKKNRAEAIAAQTAQQPQKLVELARLQGLLKNAIAANKPNYTLVSFDPAQYLVESQLEYTDKIFLVDFKRPAAGILDLKDAQMDDEQYFAKVQADVTERTIEDVSGALETITSPISSLKAKQSNSATPSSAANSISEINESVNFQKSVVAMCRFDISEPGWEEQMMCFINQKLTSKLELENEMALPTVEFPAMPNPSSLGSAIGN